MVCFGDVDGEGSVYDGTTSSGVQSSFACSADINFARTHLLLRRRRVCSLIR